MLVQTSYSLWYVQTFKLGSRNTLRQTGSATQNKSTEKKHCFGDVQTYKSDFKVSTYSQHPAQDNHDVIASVTEVTQDFDNQNHSAHPRSSERYESPGSF